MKIAAILFALIAGIFLALALLTNPGVGVDDLNAALSDELGGAAGLFAVLAVFCCGQWWLDFLIGIGSNLFKPK